MSGRLLLARRMALAATKLNLHLVDRYRPRKRFSQNRPGIPLSVTNYHSVTSDYSFTCLRVYGTGSSFGRRSPGCLVVITWYAAPGSFNIVQNLSTAANHQWPLPPVMTLTYQVPVAAETWKRGL
jgi:hypothetical protein